MTWTTPVTWTAGQVVGATDLNAQIRDNENFLFNGEALQKILRIGNYSTTSTSFVDIDVTNLISTQTITTGRVRCIFVAPVTMVTGASAGTYIAFDTIVDSTTRAGDATQGSASSLVVPSGTETYWLTMVTLHSGLSGGSHTFKPQWKTSNASFAAVIQRDSGGNTTPITFWVEEF